MIRYLCIIIAFATKKKDRWSTLHDTTVYSLTNYLYIITNKYCRIK